MEMRSAWIKWARAVELQRILGRGIREFAVEDSHEYVRCDNAQDADDPLIRIHWRLKIKKQFPERWSVLIGDILTNLRAALDHTFWAAAVMHTGQPAKPTQVQFPITTRASSFAIAEQKLRTLVAPDVWALIEAMQPFHGGDQAHTAPLEVLRWLSNIDKHRFVHVVGRNTIDLDLTMIRSETPLEVVDEWRHEGQVEGDNAVVMRLKLKRPRNSARSIADVIPTFAYFPSLQISDEPVEFRTLASAMEVMTNDVLKVIGHVTDILGLPFPDSDSFELGEEHDAIAPEYGGDIFTFREHDGTIHRFNLAAGELDQRND
ncbi:hypothetical protein [Amycolatopsis anabasis]|uniref:hypothetical protein n=1 Tax=Amycolatopsis anabasis TaxID=1840409 RepID=UPI00131AFE37|nr:hypothetical protein [Amycolatopsis anabasis]